MRTPSCRIELCKLVCFYSIAIAGCCQQIMQGESVTESPRLVDCVVRGNNGETLFEKYKGDRVFTYSYLTNNAGDKVTSVYCGYPSDCSLVHKRLYGKNGKIVRTEAIIDMDPMVLKLEVYDPDTEDVIHSEWITQGEARRYFCDYCQQKGLSEKGVVGCLRTH